MAVKIVRQPNKIALIGAATSAGGHAPGLEKAPAALRAAGLVERLQAAGYEVADLGDIEPQLFQAGDETPRVRNAAGVLAALNALKPRVEQAAKSGALALVLGGDCTIALATVAGLRRYHKQVGLVWFDRDADLNVPATTPSGRLDGMVVATATGRGAPELVRFWGEPPLVREPDILLFGVDRMDPPEREFLENSPMLRFTAAEVSSRGPARAAEMAAERVHASRREFVLHFDVDVIAAEDFGACDVPGPGGLRLDEVGPALEVFVRQDRLAALEITEFNPERDPDGSKAKLLVDLIVSALTARREALAEALARAEAEAAAKAEKSEKAEKKEAAAESTPPEEEKPAAFPRVVTSPSAAAAGGHRAAAHAGGGSGGEKTPAFIYQPPPPAAQPPAAEPPAAEPEPSEESAAEPPAAEPAAEQETAPEDSAGAAGEEVAAEPSADAPAGEPEPSEDSAAEPAPEEKPRE